MFLDHNHPSLSLSLSQSVSPDPNEMRSTTRARARGNGVRGGESPAVVAPEDGLTDGRGRGRTMGKSHRRRKERDRPTDRPSHSSSFPPPTMESGRGRANGDHAALCSLCCRLCDPRAVGRTQHARHKVARDLSSQKRRGANSHRQRRFS